MNKFKVGDNIIVKENFWEIKSNVVCTSNMRRLAGKKLEIKYINSVGDVTTKQDDSNNDSVWNWDENWVELYTEPNKEITWETLKWKDVLVNKEGDEQIVLGVLNDLVFVSYTDNFKKALSISYHKQELQDRGYTIKQATPVVEPKETIEVGGYTYKLVK